MKKLCCSLSLILLLTSAGLSQKKLTTETEKEKTERMAWWVHDRFGMFIHWGLYAMPARHEWVKTHEQIPEEEYQIYFDLFNPDGVVVLPRLLAKEKRAGGIRPLSRSEAAGINA